MLISWKEKKQFPRLQNNKDDYSVWFYNQGDGPKSNYIELCNSQMRSSSSFFESQVENNCFA